MKFKIESREKREKVVSLYLEEGNCDDICLCGIDTNGDSNIILVFKNGRGYRLQMDGKFIINSGLKVDAKNQLVLWQAEDLECNEKEEI